MRTRGIGRLRQYAAWTRRQLTGSAVILLYHRVAEPAEDPQLLCVTPRNFSEQMSVLRKFGKPLPLTELVTLGRDRNLPQQGIVVTFDDGYADNLHNAKPALARYEIPATVFVTAGQVGSTEEYWWDELERLLLEPSRLPEVLVLRTDTGGTRLATRRILRLRYGRSPEVSWMECSVATTHEETCAISGSS